MYHLRRRSLLGAITAGVMAAFLTAPAAAATAAPAPTYRAVDLGTLAEGDWAEARAINERGHVVGHSGPRAVLWRNGRIVDLGTLPGGAGGRAIDLNERDEVVGNGHTAGGHTHAFLWRNGRMRDLGVLPGGENSYAAGINDAGEIVGWSETPRGDGTFTLHAVRWRAGRMIDLDPGGVHSIASDITDNGWILGSRVLPAPSWENTAVVWRRGVRIILRRPGHGMAANERYQATGIADDGASFLWSRGRATMIEPPAGGSLFQAYDINNRTQLVGGTGYAAVLWQRGEYVVLPDLTGSVSIAYGLNDRGQVVGSSATTPDGLNHHAVLWTR